jgi:hypothetical protein
MVVRDVGLEDVFAEIPIGVAPYSVDMVGVAVEVVILDQ